MKNQFYSHLIEINIVYAELDSVEMSKEEKARLKELIASNVHHLVIDTVLSNLSLENKKIFLKHLATDDHNEVWKHLTSNIKGIEGKIKKIGKEIKEEFIDDIKKAKSKIS